MSEQDGTQATALQRPPTDDPVAWETYWIAQGQPWRTEPEIDAERQKYLAERRNIAPVIEHGVYPFKGIKLSRADIEWLLATHEQGKGRVDWRDVQQRTREGLDLRGADLRKVDLHALPLARTRSGLKWLTTPSEWLSTTADQLEMATIHLEGANLKQAHLEGAHLINAYMEEAYLVGAHLNEANLSAALLGGAYLVAANLEDANLTGANLTRTNLRSANLSRATLTGAYLDPVTDLANAVLGEKNLGFASLGDITWGGADLTVVDWRPISTLGEEQKARRSKRFEDYQAAMRANRQLAVALQTQGLNEEADHFAYRGKLLERTVWRLEKRPLKYLLSWFLYVLAGYGYRPLRSIVIYLLVVFGFAVGYYEVTHLLHAQPYPLAWYEALILSVSSFHGRGFFQPVQSLGDPVAILASIEAVFGLLIEISFIATFTQRFFGK